MQAGSEYVYLCVIAADNLQAQWCQYSKIALLSNDLHMCALEWVFAEKMA